MLKFLKRFKVKKFLSILLSLVVLVGVVAGTVKLIQFATKVNNKVVPSYSVGSLNSVGEYNKSDSGKKDKIYTKDYFECLGLTITPDFDSTISYEVFLYDIDGNFYLRTGSMTKAYSVNTQYARYARIVIKPDTDDNILFYEIYKYSRQLKIEVSKNQVFASDEQEIANNNIIDKAIKYEESTCSLDSNNKCIITSSNVETNGCYELNVIDFKKVNIEFTNLSNTQSVDCYFVDDNSNLKGSAISFTSSNMESLQTVPSGATKLIINYISSDQVSVFEIKG